jgi:hypothetical protein
MKSLHSQAALLTLAALAALAACKRADTGTQMPAAAEAKAPAATAPTALASAAEAINPLSAKDEISAMMDRFVTVKSYHVDMNTSSPKGDMAMDLDFVAPDRYRMKMPMGTQYVIGDTMYMAMNGRTMKMAIPKGQISNYRDPAQIAANKATMTVESLGNDTIEGQAAKKFLVRNTEPRQVESTIWVGADGYPLRIEVNGEDRGQVARTTISYSRFNDPSIRIDPPQ